ncbi:hypothetical protein SEPCBS119000_004825 [Sporothrix epigloea]|uniref:C2H2-type domain-containing protein n=1 Tax=Sporothrix epigloea TaxID=1892477 RepID=A0ABP0DUE6_9PEZI
MTESFKDDLFLLLQAAREQKAAFATEIEKIADRCFAEHTQTTTTKDEPSTTAAIRNDDADVEMRDADAQSTGEKNTAAASIDAASTAGGFFCRPCYNDVLTLVYHTYASPAQPQWYESQKTTFLAELERRLDDVRTLRVPLTGVDEWIAAQFNAWLRSYLRDTIALQTLVEDWDSEKDAFGARLADPALAVPELLRNVIAKSASLADGDQVRVVADAEAAVKKLQDTSSSSSKRSDVLMGSLFTGGVPDLPAVRAVEQKLREGTMGVGESLGELARDSYNRQDEDALAAKTEKHRKRLAEMRRAKAAHEAQKLKKMKPVDVPYFLQDDASCAACKTASDPQKSPFCMARHLATEHACAAGDRCCRAKPEADGARDEPRYYFCRECVLSFSIGTVYCNERCAARDFRRHREKVHLPNREIRAEQRDDADDLVYSATTKTSYKAADISRHLLSIREAMGSCQKKHPDWSLTEVRVKITLPWSA